MPNRFPIYRGLLKLYPKQYREKYADQMIQTLADMLDDQSSKRAKAMVWLRTSFDTPIGIAQQYVMVLGGNLVNETPAYIKRNSLVGGLFVSPFFIIVASGILHNQTLMNNRSWVLMISIGLIVLPALAFIINAGSYIKWFINKSGQQGRSILSRLLDVKHTWPTVLIGGIGLLLFLFVPFHDSAHCVVGNPVRVAHNPSQTWQCVDRGFLGGK